MSNTEEIVVKVSQEVAEAYRKATEDEQQQIVMRIGAILKASMRSKSEALARLRQTMDKISAEAIAKGLTPEILWSPEFLSTFGAWQGEPLERPEQGDY
jgi:hypothetical protein